MTFDLPPQVDQLVLSATSQAGVEEQRVSLFDYIFSAYLVSYIMLNIAGHAVKEYRFVTYRVINKVCRISPTFEN